MSNVCDICGSYCTIQGFCYFYDSPDTPASVMEDMGELEMEDANQAFDEAYPPEHWSDMASFGDNGWD